jgi:hypothetical protein
MKLAQALVNANKDFDMLVFGAATFAVPSSPHALAEILFWGDVNSMV